MKLFEAWNILQDLSFEDDEWRKAANVVAVALYAEGFGWLAPDYRKLVDDARGFVWMKIQEDSAEEGEAFGNIGHVESDKQVLGILRISVKNKVSDLYKHPKPPEPKPAGGTTGSAEEKERVLGLIADRYQALADEFVGYLKATKRQKRTIQSAEKVLSWDVRLLRGNHTYEDLIESFRAEEVSKKGECLDTGTPAFEGGES